MRSLRQLTPSSSARQNWPRHAGYLALGLLLLLAGLALPQRVDRAASALASLTQAASPAEQYRQTVGADLYDALLAADQLLPQEARVLLVTSGQDLRHGEYTAYHRALYLLLPRQIWWVAPVARDGSWESLWWQPVALEPAALEQAARQHGAAYLLALKVAPRHLPGALTAELPGDARLVALPAQDGQPAPLAARLERPLAGGWWWLQLIAALGLPLLGGMALLRLVNAPTCPGAPELVERLALGWLAGAGLLSLALYWLLALDVASELLPPAIAAIILGFTFHVSRFTLRPGSGKPEPRTSESQLETLYGRTAVRPYSKLEAPRQRALTALLLAWLLLEIGLLVLSTLGQPLSAWDSWVSWGMRARAIYLSGGVGDALLSDSSRAVTQPGYPLLVPLLQSWIYTWLGAADDRFAAAPDLLFYLALLGLCFSALRRRAPAPVALAGTLALATMPYVAGFAGLAYSDIPLAAYLLGAATLLRHWLRTSHRADLALALLLGGLLPWVKAEGGLLLLALCLGLTALGGRARRAIPLLLGSAALIAGPWYLRIAAHGLDSQAYHQLSLTSLPDDLRRLPEILQLFGRRAAQLEWRGLWTLVALGGVWCIARRKAPPLYLGVATIYLVLMLMTYMLSDYAPLSAHIASSADRLLLQVAPLAALWLAELAFGRAVLSTEQPRTL